VPSAKPCTYLTDLHATFFLTRANSHRRPTLQGESRIAQASSISIRKALPPFFNKTTCGLMRQTNKPGLSYVRSIVSGALANLITWYDWYIYSAFAIYFSASFFPKGDQTVQLLQTAGVFALGFLMRPVGGWVLGSFADRYGRRKSMFLSVTLMSFGALLIAVTPTYETIGVYAPLLLLLARLIQGLSIGGGTGISTAYLSEMAPPHRRGYYASFQYATLAGGQLIALGLLILLQKFLLSDQELHQWGWRIPFAIGALLTLVVFYLDDTLHETKAYQAVSATQQAKKAKWRQLMKHPKAILMVVGLTVGGTLAFYTSIIYMQKYLVNTAGISKEDSTLITFLCLLIFALIQPLFGALSDRIGRRPLLIAFGILGTILTIPVMTAIRNSTSNGEIFILLLAYLVVLSAYSSISVVVKAELFPAEVRVLGIGLPHALTVALFGGSAEYVALWLKNVGYEMWFYWYVTLAIFISLILFVSMKETRTHNQMSGEPHG
jgi:MHS family alpha-ketoglutarate permease-like MFS transporter